MSSNTVLFKQGSYLFNYPLIHSNTNKVPTMRLTLCFILEGPQTRQQVSKAVVLIM